MSEEIQETVENKETEETEVKEPESKESIIEKIGKKISNFVNGEETEEVAEVKIPEDFSKAALELGWKNDEISEFAKDYTEEELLEMIPALIGEDSEESEESSNTKEETPKEPKEKRVEDSQEDERIQKLLDRIEALEKAQEADLEDGEKQELANMVKRASKIFDGASEEFEVFGKTEDLPKFPGGQVIPTSPQMKARSEVWDMAYRLESTGLDFENAMSVAMNAFKGKNLAKDVQRKLIKDLKNNETKLGGKRTSHTSGKVAKTGIEVIEEVARRHGVEIPG